MDLVLNTLGAEVSEGVFRALLSGKEVEIMDTSLMKIAHCVGCNQCWLRTPGVCAFKDDYEEILKKLVKTDSLWIVTDTRFGFLDYRGKRLMDRVMPMLNMYIGFRDGWMRHELRYHPLNIGLLYKGAGDQALLEDWCVRTAANIGGKSMGAFAIPGAEEKLSVSPVISSAVEKSPLRHLVITGNSTISPIVRNGMLLVKPFLPTNISL